MIQYDEFDGAHVGGSLRLKHSFCTNQNNSTLFTSNIQEALPYVLFQVIDQTPPAISEARNPVSPP